MYEYNDLNQGMAPQEPNSPQEYPVPFAQNEETSSHNTPPQYHEPEQRIRIISKPKKSRTWALILAVALCCSLVGGAMGAGGMLLLQAQRKEPETELPEPQQTETLPEPDMTQILQGQREHSVIDIVTIDTNALMTPAEVYAANVNSTVGITTSVTTNYWGYQSTAAASGSGFIISSDGYILTNYHVIEDSNRITVSMYNGDSYEAELVGCDESNDIAVLKVEAEDLVPVILGNSDNLNVGDSVVAIGNPLGELTFTLTSGAISAKDREVTFSGNMSMNLLQTDCAINSGNSGGALFNLYGEVIGVTNAKYSTSSSSSASIDNIGFAIPVNSIMNIVKSIIEHGYIAKPYIGVTIADVSAETQQYGVPAGAAIQKIFEDSPAAHVGLQKGDIITAIDGTEVNANQLIEYVSNCTPGQTVALTVYRQGQILEISVEIGEQIQAALPEQAETQQLPQQSYPYPWGKP